MPASGLPETFEDSGSWFDEVFRGMHATAFMAEKWTFQMDTERASLHCVVVAGVRILNRFDGVGEPFQRLVGLIERRRHGGGEIAGNAMNCQEAVQTWQFGRCGLHYIEAGAAVHVNVDETGREDGVG